MSEHQLIAGLALLFCLYYTHPFVCTQVEGLRASYWLDDATRTVAVQMVVLNGQEGFWAWVSQRTDFSRGGRGDPSSYVGTVQVQPYWATGKIMVCVLCALFIVSISQSIRNYFAFLILQPVVIICDIVTVLYWIYLVLGTSRRIGSIVFKRGSFAAKMHEILS